MKSLSAISTKISILCDKVASAIEDLNTNADQIIDYKKQLARSEETAKVISKGIAEERRSWDRSIQSAKKFTRQLDKLLRTVNVPPKKKRKKSKKVKKTVIIPIVRCAIDALESRSGANDE